MCTQLAHQQDREDVFAFLPSTLVLPNQAATSTCTQDFTGLIYLVILFYFFFFLAGAETREELCMQEKKRRQVFTAPELTDTTHGRHKN